MQITFYQLQYIKIATENIDIPSILNSVKRSRDSKRKKTWYANILGTPEHDTIKPEILHALKATQNKSFHATTVNIKDFSMARYYFFSTKCYLSG